jgi:DNA invertase Pin-like site-specific DNA recombinase
MISPSALRSLRLVRVHCKRARSVRCLSSEPGQGAQIDTATPNGELMFGIFASLAEFERELIRERTKAGMRAARRRGKRVGRPRTLTPEKLDMAPRLLAEGKVRAVTARRIGVDPATLRRALNARG